MTHDQIRTVPAIRIVLSYTIGPAIWGSSLALMGYGLWVGAWYGYVFALTVLVAVCVLTIGLRGPSDADIKRMLKENHPDEDWDDI